MKIHIYYRHYNISGREQRRPEWFDYERCYTNLLSTLADWSSNKYNINVVYDGGGKNWILKHPYHTLHNINAGSDFKSFQIACDIVKNDSNISTGDLIYFVENDYVHVDGWLDKVFELFTTYEGLNYVSLYDHNDKYFLAAYDELVSKIITTKSHHWRTTPSTCGTFIVTKELFHKDYDILSTMEGDHNKWLWLNSNKERHVITPIPGLATHCMEGLLSPTIDWQSINNQ
jgi:hypothetical protein